MSRRQGTAAIVATPALIGAVTVLVIIVAVFLAYTANQGLPFIPTYEIRAELPSGAKLVAGNDVRVGGFRVGVVNGIETKTGADGGPRGAIAVVKLKLDKQLEPLSADTRVRVRPRSALGLKYVELTPGTAKQKLRPGDHIPLARGSEAPDLEDVIALFEEKTRDDVRRATRGSGDALAARGHSLNESIANLRPLMAGLDRAMTSLAAPRTRLERLFPELERSASTVAPVARVQASLFAQMARTFDAIGSDRSALEATIERSPSTLEAGIRSLAVQRPFLAEFRTLSARLRPAASELSRALPALDRALKAGTPVLPQTVAFNDRLRDTSESMAELFANPNTLMTFRALGNAFDVSRPAVEYIVPFQTVCNYSVYWWHPLGEMQSPVATGPSGGGTVLMQGVKNPNTRQPNNFGTFESSRPWDVPPGMDPIGAKDAFGGPLQRPYAAPYPVGIDDDGKADCFNGQFGYIRGPHITGGRYEAGVLADGTPTGGNWPVLVNDFPPLAGGTFKSIELGIDHVEDVP